MTRVVWGFVAAALVIVGVFFFGRWTAPADGSLPVELVSARIRADSLRLARVADSIELARARAATDSAAAAATRQVQRAAAAERVTRAYRDSVRVLNDTLAELHSSAGAVDSIPLPSAVVGRIRADSVTIAEQSAAVDSLNRTVAAAEDERAKAQANEATSNRELLHLRNTVLPLERETAYGKGKRDGRNQVVKAALAAVGTVGLIFGGIKLAAAIR